jgi:glycosyltransferase involved in cell wall biosynthesis
MLLLPSRSDSFGIVILEAWAHAKPVVAADSGGIPGVIDHGVNGLLVPFGRPRELAAAIGRLLRDVALARSLGENGRRKLASEYSWNTQADRQMALYESLLA